MGKRCLFECLRTRRWCLGLGLSGRGIGRSRCWRIQFCEAIRQSGNLLANRRNIVWQSIDDGKQRTRLGSNVTGESRKRRIRSCGSAELGQRAQGNCGRRFCSGNLFQSRRVAVLVEPRKNGECFGHIDAQCFEGRAVADHIRRLCSGAICRGRWLSRCLLHGNGCLICLGTRKWHTHANGNVASRIQCFGGHDVIADREIDIAFDHETAGRFCLAVADLLVIHENPNGCTGRRRARNEDFGPFEFHSQNTNGRRFRWRGRRRLAWRHRRRAVLRRRGRCRLWLCRHRCRWRRGLRSVCSGRAFRYAHQAACLAGCGYHGKQLAVFLRRYGNRGGLLRLHRVAIRAGRAKNNFVVTGLERVVEDGNEITASFDLRLGNHLTIVDDFELGAGHGLASDDGGAIRLDTKDIEGWHLCRVCGGRGRGRGGSRRCWRGRRLFRNRCTIIGASEDATETTDLSCSSGCIRRQATQEGNCSFSRSARRRNQSRGGLIQRFGNGDVVEFLQRVLDLLSGSGELFIGRHLVVREATGHILDGLVCRFRQPADFFGHVFRVLGGVRQEIARLFATHFHTVLDVVASLIDYITNRLVVTGHAWKNEEDHEQRRDAQHDKRQQSGPFIVHCLSPGNVLVFTLR